MKVAAYKTQLIDDQVVIERHTGESIASSNPSELLKWLLKVSRKDTVNLAWNLDDALAPLLRLLPKRHLIELNDTHKCCYSDFKIFYMPAKVFSLEQKEPIKFELFTLDQYYPAMNYQSDLAVVAQLGQHLVKTLNEMGFKAERLTSPVKIFEVEVLNHLDLPTAWDMPKDAAEWAWYCSGKNLIECHCIGTFKDIFDYDQRNAFSQIAMQLIDYRACHWTKSKDYKADAIYGFCKAVVTINDNVSVSPILHTNARGYLCSVVGTFETYITKDELDFITKWQLGSWQIIDGWWAIPYRVAVSKPLALVGKRLLAQREAGGLKSDLAKRMAVGAMYGKTLEEHRGEFGRHFSPVFGAMITTRCRLKTAEFIYSKKLIDSLIHISLDGCLVNKEVAVNGNWKVEPVGEAIVLSSGLIWYNNKRPKGLSIEDVKAMINTKPDGMYWQREMTRRLTLAEAVDGERRGGSKQYSLDWLGKEIHPTTSVDLYGADRDRYFVKLPKTGSDLLGGKVYTSEPFKVGAK